MLAEEELIAEEAAMVLPEEDISEEEAAAIREAVQAAADAVEEMVEFEQPPEVMTLLELEQQLRRVETALEMADDVAPRAVWSELDDALQGVTTILALSFSGDVQQIVLRFLQVYREGKGLR
jgi:hypothetical protein